MRTLRAAGVAVLVVVSGCGEIPNVPSASYVAVVYDPATGNLPTPNDLALVGGKVAIPVSPLLSAAENELKQGFNGLDGFSSASSARVQFTGALSAASLTDDTVVALDLGEHGKGTPAKLSLQRSYTDCDHALQLSNPAGFTPGHTYLFAVRGGENGLKGAAGEEVVESPAFHYLRAGKDLTQHADALPGATRADRLATAQKLEAVRQGLEPLFQVLEAQGLPRREVVGLWHFTVHTATEALFDPASKRIPFPNDLLRDPKTGLVSLPADPADKPEQAALKKGFNQLDGFSTTAAWSVETTTPMDRATITAQTVRAFEVESKKEVVDLDRVLSQDGKKLVLQPRSALTPNASYVVVLQGVKDLKSAPVTAMPLPSVLKLSNPLTDPQGGSVVSTFCNDTAALLEGQRSRISPLLESAGIDRAKVSAVWLFKTEDILGRARELWETPYSKQLPLTLTNVKVTDNPFGLTKVAKKVTGTFTTFDRIDPSNRAFKPNGQGEARQVEFILWVPKNVPAGQKVPVVVIGHGLTTDRTMGEPLANALAGLGKASMAIDFPLHGERTVCTTDSHCLNSTCAADGTCRTASGAKGDFALVPPASFGINLPAILPSFNIPGVPAFRSASLDAWVDVENLFGTRDHFRQAYIDLSAQVRLIRQGDFTAHTGGLALDGDKLDYVGVSLGSIIGGAFGGIDPHLRKMLLNVGGADLVDLIRESNTFGGTLKKGLAAKGINEGTPQYEQFVNAARWALDEVDPTNLAPYARLKPLSWKDPATGQTAVAPVKKLRLQMANGDFVVPNSSTEHLVTATGIDRATEFKAFTAATNHVFLLDLLDPLDVPGGQRDMTSFLENN
ncbi:MAG: Ig-like domain-containing protein [Myxococcaceae bacterium]|nr:Ig-like domain-containing protein [Myxococcaceae bacterium]